MAKFKNIANEDLTVIGVGKIKAGETVELPRSFHNANFMRVKVVEAEEKKEKIINK